MKEDKKRRRWTRYSGLSRESLGWEQANVDLESIWGPVAYKLDERGGNSVLSEWSSSSSSHWLISDFVFEEVVRCVMKIFWVGMELLWRTQRGEERGKQLSWEVRYLWKMVKGSMEQYCSLLTTIWLPSKKGSALCAGRRNSYWLPETMTVDHLEIFFQFWRWNSSGEVNSPNLTRAKKPVSSMVLKRRSSCKVDPSNLLTTFWRSPKVRAHFHFIGEFLSLRQSETSFHGTFNKR